MKYKSIPVISLVLFFIVISLFLPTTALADGNQHIAPGSNPEAEKPSTVNFEWMCNPTPSGLTWVGKCSGVGDHNNGTRADDPQGFKEVYTPGYKGYGLYQCVWYAINRLGMVNGHDGWTGNQISANGGQMWRNIQGMGGWTVTTDNPEAGMGMSATVSDNSTMTKSNIGHVAVVEKVNSDGSIWLSEGNWNNEDGVWKSYHTRTMTKSEWKGIRFFKKNDWKTKSNDAASSNSSNDKKSSDKKNANGVPDEKDLVGMASPEGLGSGGEVSALPESPDYSQLSQEDQKSLATLQETDDFVHSSHIEDTLVLLQMILAWCIVIYGTLVIWLAFLLDKSNTILNFSALGLISGGHYKAKTPGAENKKGKVRYLDWGGVALVSICCVILGYILMSGLMVDWLSDLMWYSTQFFQNR